MKHVARPAHEPAALAAYRLSHAADDRCTGEQAAEAWERFRDEGVAYRELRDALLSAQQGLCAFCEQRLTKKDGTLVAYDFNVEHVLAKSGGAGRTLDWTNLLLCCGGGTYREKDPRYLDAARHYAGRKNVTCGHNKGGAELPPGCDPRSFRCSPRLVDIDADGVVRPNAVACGAAGVDPEQLRRTIDEVLNLNCPRLQLQRRGVVGAILEQRAAKELEHEFSHLNDEELALSYGLFVAGRLKPDTHGHLQPFWTTERQYLEPASTAWIAANAALLRCPPAPPPPSAPGTTT